MIGPNQTESHPPKQATTKPSQGEATAVTRPDLTPPRNDNPNSAETG